MITTGMGRLNEFVQTVQNCTHESTEMCRFDESVQTVQNCTHGLELWDLWPKKAVLLMCNSSDETEGKQGDSSCFKNAMDSDWMEWIDELDCA